MAVGSVPPPGPPGGEQVDFARWARHYLQAKTRHDLPALLAHFAPDCRYEDAVLSRRSTREQLRVGYEQILPQLPEGIGSHLLWAAGTDSGGVVRFDNDPQLFGVPMPVLAVVELAAGLVVRQRDYWDGRVLGGDRLEELRRRFPPHTPVGAGTAVRGHPRADRLSDLVEALWPRPTAAFAHLLAPDVLLRDLTTGRQVVGRDLVVDLLGASWQLAPYGAGASVAAVVGGDEGGAVEWRARDEYAATVGGGVLGVRLVDAAITELAWCWDASRVSAPRAADLDERLLRDAR